MFCPKCGAQNGSGARFCGKCGAPLGSAENVYGATQQSGAPAGNVYGAPYQPGAAAGYAGTPRPARPAAPSRSAGSGKGKLIAIVAAALVVVTLLGCWIFGSFGGGGYEDVVDDFLESIYDGDAKGIIDCLPDDLMDYWLAQEEGISKREVDEEFQEVLDDIYEDMPSGVKRSHKILRTEDIYGDDLRCLKEDYEEIGVKVTAAKYVEVKLTASYMGMSESTEVELCVIEVGGSWYIDTRGGFDIGSLLIDP